MPIQSQLHSRHPVLTHNSLDKHVCREEAVHMMQVKKVPGVGKPEDSCMIDGAVCRKNLAHKRMSRHIMDPKILMVAKNLEFNRAQSRLTSLEGMTKQEVRPVTIALQHQCIMRLL